MNTARVKSSQAASYTDYLADYYFHLQNAQRKGKCVLPKHFERGVERVLRKRSPDRERLFVRLVLGE